MAEGGGLGLALGDDADTRLSFFNLGEIRVARESDFQCFLHLAENHEGWVKKLDKNGLIVWNRDTGKTSIKMFKVLCEFMIYG